MVDFKTIFQIQHSQRNATPLCADVSWISPYSSEQEMIMKFSGAAFFDPSHLFSECKCSQQLTCHHNVQKCFTKVVTICHPSELEKEKKVICLKKKMMNFVQKLENHKRQCLPLFEIIYCSFLYLHFSEVHICQQGKERCLIFLQRIGSQRQIDIYEWNFLMLELLKIYRK